jgi:hypothetical protein
MRDFQRTIPETARNGKVGAGLLRHGLQRKALALVLVWGAVAGAQAQSAGTANWQPIGPAAVETSNYGLVTGRISALALDPSDATGNRLYVGTTGGGVWLATNAASATVSDVVFTPLTDNLAALSGAIDASLSIGALTVQPGGSCATGGAGVILAGSGDPNNAQDSYYGAGILRSTDCGNTWSLIQSTVDGRFYFVGEGFAGFAWSTANPQLVVAAISQAYEGALVNAEISSGSYYGSYEGLYYSSDSGATWTLATITDPGWGDVQSANDSFDYPHGNAATSVVWNPVRQIFVAAVRLHGYYQSADGITWTRMTAQPGTNLTTANCPANSGATGSSGCPIFRGTLAVNPQSGDTFAWTVDSSNQDQGLWQDSCAIDSSGACANAAIVFAARLSTTALETSSTEKTIANGDYTLALAAVPASLGAGQDTILLAGADDLWKCSLAAGCSWRNATNTTDFACQGAAMVGEFQHALAWNADNPEEIFIGNDSGLWRSEDAVGVAGSTCDPSDVGHFQNLNGGIGSLAETVSLAQSSATPYALMIGLGVNGTAGVKDAAQPSGNWPQILGGYGGPVAIGPIGSDWYVNSSSGVFIQKCSQSAECTAALFGTTAVVNMNGTSQDGASMTLSAPFIVDPLDSSYLLVATCRVWRVPANGTAWSVSDAVSPILDGGKGTYCNGDALIRSIAALALPVSTSLPHGGEVVYVGMYGAGVTSLPGHVLSATFDPSSATLPVWTDQTANSVSNDSKNMNALGLDISSIVLDAHDLTGKTVYVTVEGNSLPLAVVQPVYRSTDGGATWASITSNLPAAPVSSLVVDPQDANTVYVATDRGVYSTRAISTCAKAPSTCWSVFGAGLPLSPIVALSATPATAAAQLLTAATYGRGLWQIPLWTATANSQLTTVSATPASLTFASEAYGSTSAAQTVTLKNTGSHALTVTAIVVTGNFSESDGCVNALLSAGATCTIQVTFTPAAQGSLTGDMTISANVLGGEVTIALSGTGTAAPLVNLTPDTIDFGGVEVGTTSLPLQVTVNNGTASAISYASSITGPFAVASNTCLASSGASEMLADNSCQMKVTFTPTAAEAASGALTITDAAGTQTVALSGTGLAPPTDVLSPASLTFPATVIGQLSAAQTVSLTNSGGGNLTSISTTASGPFMVTNNCTTILAADSSCSISVVFQPTAVGTQTGTLTVSDILKTQTVALSGTGTASTTGSDFALTVSPSSRNVSSGQTADFTLTITPSSSVQATYALQYGILPANARWLTNPSSETISGGAGENVTVEIATGQTSLATVQLGPGGVFGLLLFCGVMALPLSWRRARKALLMAALLALLSGGVSSCVGSGGGVAVSSSNSSGASDSSATPSGTYSIPITVTNSGVQCSVTLTLIVD